MAPEALDARVNLHDIQSFKQIDIYAMALIIWEIASRCTALEGMHVVHGRIKPYDLEHVCSRVFLTKSSPQISTLLLLTKVSRLG